MDGIEGGYFGAYIGCSPEKGAKAIRMMRQEFEKLMATAVPEKELSAAKNYLIGRHDIDLQRNSAVANSILFDQMYGNNPDETFHFGESIRGITARQVQELAQKMFSRPAVLAAVGPTSPF
jgi:zinc protease